MFLTLNGIQFMVDLAEGPVSRKSLTIGKGYWRAFSGKLNESRRRRVKEWSLVAGLDSQTNIAALRQLLNDTVPSLETTGDHWTMDSGVAHLNGGNIWSDKGDNVAFLSHGAVWQSSGKWTGAGSVSLPTNTSTVSFLGHTPSTGWWAAVWHNDAGVWNGYVFTYTNGVLTTLENGVAISNPSWVSFSFGPDALTFTGTGTATDAVADLAIYSFAAPSSWASQVAAFQTGQQWPTGGTLQMGGDLGSKVVVARMPASKVVVGAVAGAAYSATNERPNFTLREV